MESIPPVEFSGGVILGLQSFVHCQIMGLLESKRPKRQLLQLLGLLLLLLFFSSGQDVLLVRAQPILEPHARRLWVLLQPLVSQFSSLRGYPWLELVGFTVLLPL